MEVLIVTGNRNYVDSSTIPNDLTKLINEEKEVNIDDPRITENKSYIKIFNASALYIRKYKPKDLNVLLLILKIAARGHLPILDLSYNNLGKNAIAIAKEIAADFKDLMLFLSLVDTKLDDATEVMKTLSVLPNLRLNTTN
jgi:hypothetical protein